MTRSNVDPGFDPRVADWLEADPERAPEAVLDTVLAAFPSIPQRRPVLVRWRPPAMNRLALLAAAAATIAVSIVAVSAGGLFQVTRPAIVASPSPTLTPVPSASATATPLPSPHFAGNGLIAIVRSQDLVLVDPLSGRTTNVLVKRPDAPPEEAAYAATDLAWSPDGRRLAYASHAGPVAVVDIATRESRDLFPCGIEADGCTIAWSPDGSQIAVGHGSRLDLVDPDSGAATGFTLPVSSVLQPTWAPDGSRIAFHSIGGSEVQDRRLYVVDRDGSHLVQVAGPGVGGELGFWDPTWSPDGRSIAFLGSTGHESCPTPSSKGPCQDDWMVQLMELDLATDRSRVLADGGPCQCLGFSPGMTLSPDGALAAMVVPAMSDHDWGLEIVNRNGTGKRWVAEAWGPVAWQPIP